MTVTRRTTASFLAALPVAMSSATRAAPSTDASAERATALLRQAAPGTVVLMRHALAPGGGDPPGMVLADCGTQRNLSAEGRRQAERIGSWYRARGLVPRAVRSSQWCRCLDTARLAFGPAGAPWPALNSFFGAADAQPRQNAELAAELKRLAAGRDAGFEIWVTHMVNAIALVDVNPSVGEAAILRFDAAAGRPVVLGTFTAAQPG